MGNETDSVFDDPSVFEIRGLAGLRKRPDVLEKIRLDVTPRMVMEPRFHSRPEDLVRLREITGYLFYVETFVSPPALMIMKVGRTDITNTVGKVDETPPELLKEAVDKPVHPPVNGMYAITEGIKAWLRGELGL